MKNVSLIAWYLMLTCIGLLLFIAPLFFIRSPTMRDSPVFPLLRNAIEHMNLEFTVLGLCLTSCLLSFFRPQQWFSTSVGLIWFLPFFTVIEIGFDPASHNLWPFEFVIYFVLLLIAMFGGKLGATIKLLLSRVSGTKKGQGKDNEGM